MSSYQFVNSLASCYNGPAQRPGQNQDAIAAVAAVHAAASNSDYYNANNYPANCYSPQVSPHYGPYAPAATPQSHHNLAQGGTAAEYNPTHQHAVAAAAAHQRLSASGLNNTSPGAPTPPSATPVSSCKYADSTASSPQDLSTSSGNTPAPQPRSPTEAPVVVNNTVTAAPNATASAGITTANSQQSSTSSTASSNNSSGNSSKGQNSSGNPPQIYPWMKRVHLGTSKYKICLVFFQPNVCFFLPCKRLVNLQIIFLLTIIY